MHLKQLTIGLVFCATVAMVCGTRGVVCRAAEGGPGRETPAEHDARMKWFREARFGLFIHWGVYSVPAGEWKGHKDYAEWFLEQTKMPVSQYEKFARQFNPVKFDARKWVRIAKDAGVKYIVITSKHHDGFGMFRSKLTDWCIKSTPFQRDPLKELSAACKEAGIKFCVYYSIMDWHHPDWGTRRKWNDRAPATPPNMDRYVRYMKGQLKELVTGYGPLGILWFDGEWESPWTHDRGVDLYRYVRGLEPSIIINNRVGKARAGMAGMDRGNERVGDYGTPEQEIPPTGFGPGVDWESCMTMNNHWGYNRADQHWKSTRTLIRNLIDCASKGGNYLLNVGPTSEGLIPGPSVERLAEIGKWMNVNGEAIYGTTASPFKRLPFGKCTQKPGKLFLHVFDWPADGRLVVPISNRVTRAYLLAQPGTPLATAKAPAAETGEGGLTVSVPKVAPDANATVVVLEIEGAPKVLAAAQTSRTTWTAKWKAKNKLWIALHLMAFPPDKLGPAERLVAEGLAPLGFNALILEVDYNFPFKSHPELETKGLTKAQAREFAEVCREHGIRLIPLMNCLGHQSWGPRPGPLLKRYPQFDETPSIGPDDKKIYCREWCPSHPGVNKIVFELIDELIDAFDADAFHVGMDEVFLIGDKNCPRCKGKDVGDLFAKEVNALHDHLVNKKGVEMLMWSDRLLDSRATGYGRWEASSTGSCRAIDRVPKDIILCDWHYEMPATYQRMGQKTPFPSVRYFQEKGFRVLAAPWRNPEAATAFLRVAQQGATDKMLGVLFTGWGVSPDGLLAALKSPPKPFKLGRKPSHDETTRGVAATIQACLKELKAAAK